MTSRTKRGLAAGTLAALAVFGARATRAEAVEPPAAAPAVNPAVEAAPSPAPEAPAPNSPRAEPAPLAAAAPNMCEIHVWPAERFLAQTTGWLSGFGAVGALMDASANAEKDKSNTAQIANALSSEAQVDILNGMDLVKLLNLKPSVVVKHDEAPPRASLGEMKGRRATSTAPCYYELYVGQLFYQKAAMYGRTLYTQFIFRDFGSGDTLLKQSKRNGSKPLKLFPPKEGEDFQAASDELVAVFKEDFVEFTEKIGTNPTVQKAQK